MAIEALRLIGITKSRILKELRPGSRTAVETAHALGIQVTAVRKHLDRLHAMGLVEARFHREGPGRPRKRYSLTDEGREIFPRHYDAILDNLLSRLVKDRGTEYAQSLLERVAEDRIACLGGQRSLARGDLMRLVDALDAMGFEPTLQAEPATYTIASRNCPILRTAKMHRELVCTGLHAEVIRRATRSTSVERGKWMVDGDAVCTHRIVKHGQRRQLPSD